MVIYFTGIWRWWAGSLIQDQQSLLSVWFRNWILSRPKLPHCCSSPSNARRTSFWCPSWNYVCLRSQGPLQRKFWTASASLLSVKQIAGKEYARSLEPFPASWSRDSHVCFPMVPDSLFCKVSSLPCLQGLGCVHAPGNRDNLPSKLKNKLIHIYNPFKMNWIETKLLPDAVIVVFWNFLF